MALRRHTHAFAAAERFSFPPSKSSLHPENQSAGCFLLGNLRPFDLFTGITTQCAFMIMIEIDKTSIADIIQKQPALQNH